MGHNRCDFVVGTCLDSDGILVPVLATPSWQMHLGTTISIGSRFVRLGPVDRTGVELGVCPGELDVRSDGYRVGDCHGNGGFVLGSRNYWNRRRHDLGNRRGFDYGGMASAPKLERSRRPNIAVFIAKKATGLTPVAFVSLVLLLTDCADIQY